MFYLWWKKQIFWYRLYCELVKSLTLIILLQKKYIDSCISINRISSKSQLEIPYTDIYGVVTVICDAWYLKKEEEYNTM